MLYKVKNSGGETIAYTNHLPMAESYNFAARLDRDRYTIYVVMNDRDVLLTEKEVDQ